MARSETQCPKNALRNSLSQPTDAFNPPAVLLCLAFLAVLTVADTTASSAVLNKTAPLEPGYWNLGAATTIVSTISGTAVEELAPP